MSGLLFFPVFPNFFNLSQAGMKMKNPILDDIQIDMPYQAQSLEIFKLILWAYMNINF